MINLAKYKDAIQEFKEQFFDEKWEDELYKWEAIKHFQENWDIDSDDFPEMLKNSLSKTYNLLASVNNYPAAVICDYARQYPEEVREMFVDLYDENKDVFERIDSFKQKSNELRIRKDGEDSTSQSYQYENAISTYLWLRYPDKYYIYKFSEVRTVAKVLESSYAFKKGAYADNIRNFIALYNEIAELIKADKELTDDFKEHLTESCYPDPELRTLTLTFGFCLSKYSKLNEDKSTKEPSYWPDPADYDPKLSKEAWKKYINEIEINHKGCMGMLKAVLEMGGEASCKALSEKYGGHPSAYMGFAVNIGKRAKKYFNLPACMDGDTERFFPVPFLGNGDGEFYTYKLRPELQLALEETDLSEINSYYDSSEELEDDEEKRYWWLNASPKIWSFSMLPIGGEQNYSLYNDNGNKRKVFQNFLDVKEGDYVIGYEANPVKQIVALARISQESDGENICIKKTESLSNPIDYSQLKEISELANMQFFTNPNGSLFRLTKEEYETIMDIIRESNPVVVSKNADTYTDEQFLKEVYMDKAKYESLKELLKNKKNIILQGAPGVGKTFAAIRLAFSMIGSKDYSRIKFVQFHQNYSYEDFVLGYRPIGDSFELRQGIFYEFCKKAINEPKKDFFFIIDEINRGNLSKIFGELLMLIENEHRGEEVTLAYNGMPFYVPKNVYIIGMMNTADRSLALIDYALRRRFSFFEIEPGFDSEGFTEYQKKIGNETFDELINVIKDLNEEIKRDSTLGKGFCIGHSYFCNCKECTDDWMKSIVEYDIIPTLSEYWFDDTGKLRTWTEKLHRIFQQ